MVFIAVTTRHCSNSPISYYDVTTGLTVKVVILLGLQALPQSITQIYRQKMTHSKLCKISSHLYRKILPNTSIQKKNQTNKAKYDILNTTLIYVPAEPSTYILEKTAICISCPTLPRRNCICE